MEQHIRRKRACLVIVLTAALQVTGRAREFFFDGARGADTNGGTSESTPFRTLSKLRELDLQPGDIVRFRRGTTFRGAFIFQGNGTPSKPIRLTAYGTGPKPEILGSVRTTAWEQHEGEVYKHTLKREPHYDRHLYGVFEYDTGKVPVRLARMKDRMPQQRGQFHFDKDKDTVYVITSDGAAPATHAMEVSVVEMFCQLRERSWLEIDGLAFLFGNRRHVVFVDSHHITMRNCASLFVGAYGNPNIVMTQGSTYIDVDGCFLYENVNCGILFTDRTTRCRVANCTIVKCLGNDGVTLHSGGRDKNGVRQGITGDFNVVENNVIGLCPEESIDITSGDYHLIQRNICYGNGNPGIIVGHDSDHILIRNNICFGNAHAGIMVAGQPKEGSRGENVVAHNLVFDNVFPGLEIQAANTMVLNNTVIDATGRAAVRLNAEAQGSHLLNNIIVASTPRIRHPSIQFLLGTPKSFDVKMDHNLFFHPAMPSGRVIQTCEGNFKPREMYEKYGVSRHSRIANPYFAETPQRHYLLTDGSPAVDGGINAGQEHKGAFPDLGWQELGAAPPAYPAALIDGSDSDPEVVLWLWGKAPAPELARKQAFVSSDANAAATEAMEKAREKEAQEDPLEAWNWYHAALFRMAETDPRAQRARQRISELAANGAIRQVARSQFAESALARARHFLAADKPKWALVAHYLQVALHSAPEASPLAEQARNTIEQHKTHLASFLTTTSTP